MIGIFNMHEEELREYGTVEEKRAYVAQKRAEDPNWVNTIFPPGKTKQGVGWSKDWAGVFSIPTRNTKLHHNISAKEPRRARKHRRH